MSEDYIELTSVLDGDDCLWEVGSSAKSIILKADGRGPMGWYDRIHVTMSSGTIRVIPAHNAKHFETSPLAKATEKR